MQEPPPVRSFDVQIPGGLDPVSAGKLISAEIWNSLIGTLVGGFLAVVGVIIVFKGFTGSMDLGLKFGDLSANLSNATPGVAIVFVGVVVMVVFRLRATIRTANALRALSSQTSNADANKATNP